MSPPTAMHTLLKTVVEKTMTNTTVVKTGI